MGTYTISVRTTTKSTIAQIQMPALTLTLTGTFTEDTILQTIGDTIVASVASISESLLSQPDKAAAFIAVLV